MKLINKPSTATAAILPFGVPSAFCISRLTNSVTPSTRTLGLSGSTPTSPKFGSISEVYTRAVTTRFRMLSMRTRARVNLTPIILLSLSAYSYLRPPKPQGVSFPPHRVLKMYTPRHTPVLSYLLQVFLEPQCYSQVAQPVDRCSVPILVALLVTHCLGITICRRVVTHLVPSEGVHLLPLFSTRLVMSLLRRL